MAFTTVFDAVPKTITAGESVSWRVSLSDYPASSTWVLTYTLINSDEKITIASGADGADHLVEIALTTSASYPAGEYGWQAHVSNGTERYQVGSGTIKILTDFAAQDDGYDSRSHAKKVLDALEAVLENRATQTQLTQTIGPVQIQHMNLDQIIKARNEYKLKYSREQLKNGSKSKRTIKPRFYS